MLRSQKVLFHREDVLCGGEGAGAEESPPYP